MHLSAEPDLEEQKGLSGREDSQQKVRESLVQVFCAHDSVLQHVGWVSFRLAF